MEEIDSDSRNLLVSEPYFKRLQSLGHLEMLSEDPILFEGLASWMQTKYTSVMLNVQNGEVLLWGR